MELDEALEVFEEIVELCYQTENPRIIEVIEDIYPEVSESKSISKIILSLEELQVVINNEDLSDEEDSIADEIQEKIETLSE